MLTSTVLAISSCAPPPPDTAANPAPARDSASSIPAPHAPPRREREPTTAPGSSTESATTASPTAVAEQWLRHYRGASWSDPAPSAWIDRVRPYVSTAMNAENETLRHEPAGADWATFVRLRCTSTVVDIAAIVPPESPGTATAANVQATGSVRTTCAAGPAPAPTELAATTLIVVTTTHGWRVHQRLF